MGTINLGILAHVDAGKTSLTERILFETGVIATVGSVDRGSTQTDTLELERQRGITIQSTVVSFPLNGHKINLIDTPGHADFIAEVERSLLALDGVVLVISAVEGIQPQTRRLIRVVRTMGLPVILFINKIDRMGARSESLLGDIRRSLQLPILVLSDPVDIGTGDASVIERDLFTSDALASVCDLLAERSDDFLAEYVRLDGHPPHRRVQREIDRQARRGDIVPVFFGSARTGTGVDLLLSGITRYLPFASSDEDGEPSAIVFKLQRLPSGEKTAYARIYQGSLTRRDRVLLRRQRIDAPVECLEGRLTGIDAFADGARHSVEGASAGDIVQLHGLREARISDVIGVEPPRRGVARFDRPTLESIVRSVDPGRATELAAALQVLAEQDPLIDIRRDTVRSLVSVRLYGEVQKEVIAATLATEFGLTVAFEPSHVVCIEIPAGSGWAIEHIGAAGNPFLATIGLWVEPGQIGSGITFDRPSGALDLSFYRAIEETVYETLWEGLQAWAVTDCHVTITDTAMSPTTVAADYRKLLPLVLMDALRQAGTYVLEPIQRFELDCPEAGLSEVLFVLTAARGNIERTDVGGEQGRVIGTIPTTELRAVEQRLPGLAGGEATIWTEFAGYQRVVGEPPCRPRTDFNPLDRKQYLALVGRT